LDRHLRPRIGSSSFAASAELPPRGLRVAAFVDDETPEAARATRCSEVLEVERQDRNSHPLGKRHHDSVDEAEIEVGEATVELDGSAQRPGRGRRPCARRRRALRGTDARSGPATRARRTWSTSTAPVPGEQLAAELADEHRGEPMRSVTAIHRGNQRRGIGDDFQRPATSSRR